MANHTERAVTTLLEVDPGFQDLCDVLYGGAVDPETVWSDVFGKRAPQADPSKQAQREKRLKTVSQVSNAVGLAAGTAAIGSTLRDDRINPAKNPKVGRVGRALHRAGKLIPKSKILEEGNKNKRVAAALGAGAGLLQLGNVAGDIAVSRQIKKGLVPTGVPSQSKMNAGALKAAKTVTNMAKPQTGTLQPTGALGMTKRPQTQAPVAYQPMKPQTPNAPNPGGMAKRDGSFEAEGTFSKFDDDKRVAFGYASVVKHNGMPVVDKQGDYISAEDMEEAAYRYVLSSRVGGDMHKRTADDRPHHTSDLIESTVFTEEKCLAMGMPEDVAKQLDGRWWIGMKVHDDEAWQEVKKGNRKGFSIHGKGKRADHSLDDLMGYPS